MSRRVVVPLASLAILLASCGTPAIVPAPSATGQAQPHPADACSTAAQKPPIPVLFLGKEAVPAELTGLRHFVDVWGTGHSCFSGKVVTGLKGVDLSGYQVLIVDISHDVELDQDDINAVLNFIHSKRRVGVFDYAIKFGDLSRTNSLRGQETNVGRIDSSLAPGCLDWKFGAQLSSPFDLTSSSYHYQTQANLTFAMRADGPNRAWASLTCTQGGAALLEVPPGVVAGFYLANALALGDSDPGGVGMAKLVVDVVQDLTQPSAF